MGKRFNIMVFHMDMVQEFWERYLNNSSVRYLVSSKPILAIRTF